jgi:sulfite reductase (NADPH) hemoprotein beta-component
VAAYFEPPAYERLLASDAAFEQAKADNKAFARWVERNVKPHKVPGYAIAVLSLKKTGVPPGDATAEQMDVVADLADRYSFGELRVTHQQNLVLADVKQSELFGLWQEAKAHGLATPNLGLLTDIICCPGGDFCALANAKSIPIAEAIAERFDDLDFQHDIGDIDLNISGCINACGHHHVGNIGILGVDKDGAEWYQVSIGGSQGNQSAIGKIIGPSFSAHQMPAVIERILQVYVRERIEDERFIETAHRIGVTPFKEHVYATPIKERHNTGEDAYA